MSILNLEGATLSSRFRLERQLGRGGYGSVFEAEQLSVGRKCAVKVLAPKAGKDSTTEKRFRQEARTTSKLTHPNSIVLYDFGRDDQRDVLWLAMELLDGETLQSRIRRQGTMSVERCLHVIRQAAESLQEAHEIGLVHRDIKPGNIMLLDRGGDPDFVKVIDFGIAKMVRETLAPNGDMTQTGRILGTPKYMAPEQIRDTDVDGRADMYALATVVYALLTARVPFSEGTAMEIASRQITERPPKIRDIAPDLDVGHAFESVLLQALSKDPNRRFDDILSFVDALEDAALVSRTDTPKVTEKTEAIDAAAVAESPAEAIADTEADAHAETDDEVVPTTEQMAGGETPTAEVGRSEKVKADAVDAPGEREHVDVTLDTVAVDSTRHEVVDEAREPVPKKAPADHEPESSGRVVRILALVSVVVFVGAVGAWLALGDGEGAKATKERGETVTAEDEAAKAASPQKTAAAKRSQPPARPETENMPVDKPETAADDEPTATPEIEAREEERAVEESDSEGETADPAASDQPVETEAEDGEESAEGVQRPRRMTVRAIPWGDLYIDGRRVGSGSNIDVVVEPGRHEFVLEQNGEERARRTVDVSAGSPKIIELVAD